MKKLTTLVFILVGLFSFGQNSEHFSAFNMMSFTYKHDKNWMAYLELQSRSIEDFSLPDYYEVKGGIGYAVNKNHQPFIGFGKYGTYKNSDFYQNEYRLWLQYTYSFSVGKLKIDQRIRTEKRFFDFPQTGEKDNTERYRYRASFTLPLNSKKIEPNTFFTNAFNEIFLGPENPTFKRNRFFAGFGYQLNNSIGTNLGYMWQKEFSVSGHKNLHFLYFGLNFTFDRMKYVEEHQRIPVAD